MVRSGNVRLHNHDEPVDSVEVVGEHALKMGWLEKEAEESMMGGWSKRFAILTGWDGKEAHLFYYRSENDKEASGILFLTEMEIEDAKDERAFTLQGSQRRFRFRCESCDAARSWRMAIREAKSNGGHVCKAGEACLAWRKDKHAKTCQHCKRVFSVTLSKHNCRCCGRIFCSECADGEKLLLEPYTKPVRCCNECNKTQSVLIAKKDEMQQRAKRFVAKYLELLEGGSTFGDPDRPDVRRTLMLDKSEGISLQFRSLKVIEHYEVDAMLDTIESQTLTAGKGIASNLKAMTLRSFNAVRGVKNIDQRQVARAFEPEQAKQNLQAAGKAVGTFAVNTGERVADAAMAASSLAIGFKDVVSGEKNTSVQIGDVVGIADCATNPSVINRIKDKAPLAFSVAFRDVRDYGREREIIQVCHSEEEKTAWYNALSELRLLAQDAGTDILVFKKEEEETKKKITDEIRKRKESRRSRALEECDRSQPRQPSSELSPPGSVGPSAAEGGRPEGGVEEGSAARAEKNPAVKKSLTLRERMLGSSSLR